MGGKTGTTTQSVSIPPEVLARYNSVNAQAERVAATPFQPYTGQFVAGLTPTQQAGIQATSQASQAAQPYYSAATGQLMAAQQGAMPGISAAYQNVGQAQDVGSQYAQAASQYYGGAANAAMPYYGMMQQGVGGALSYAQPMNYMAQQTAAGAMGQSMPFYGAMGQGIGSALQYAQPLNYQAQQAATGAAEQAMPYYGAATQGTYGALQAAQPYQQAATQGLGAALQYSGGINAMTPEMALAAYGESRPIMNQALMGTQGAVQAGQPFQGMATQAAMAGAQGVSPETLNIGAYMSPYTQAVADATYRTMRQQQEQEMSGQLANAIRSGAFGGDRAALAATNLARQQELATAQAMAPIYQQGYGQALAAAQQQQGVGLSAAQANRAALQNLSQQLQGIGQQGYAQQLGAAGQIGQLGQNVYGQGIGAAQALSGLGQTGFGQQLQQAQALAALGQQGYGQQLGAAQQLGQLGQNIYGMGANQANLLSQLGQTGYGQQLGAAQQYGALGQNLYNMAANQANLYGQLGQLGYGQQLGAAQQYGNIGQNLYQMGLGTGQAMQGLGQQQFAQGLGSAQQLAALAQQGYGMGAGTAQQLAALGSGAQQSALQGAQAQLGAGTLEQQTQQADLTAQYQQFLQERGYPFQVAQFLANIAMGTGALSGQTTTTTQPMPFFSDRRVKHDVKEIGETHDGQPIYSFKYNGDDRTQIGLMAQDVEKKHPEAVYDIDGIKGVDYHEATKDAARPERYEGGIVPESQGGAVINSPAFGRHGYALDGGVHPSDLQEILAQQREAMGPFAEGGIYGISQHKSPFEGASTIVPKGRLHVAGIRKADTPPPMPEGVGAQALNAYDQGKKLMGGYEEAKDVWKKLSDALAEPTKAPREMGPLTEGSSWPGNRGGVVPRAAYAVGGSKDPSLPYDEEDKSPNKYFPTELLEDDSSENRLKAGQTPSSTSQSGLGLGEAFTIGKTLLSLASLSDRRAKHDVKEIGKTHDGQPIYSFKYKGSDQTQMGLMAQDVEKHNPDAVYDIGGVKAVDYKKATEGAERKGHYSGGLIPRRGYATDGSVYDPTMGKFVDATEMTPEKIAELNKGDEYSRGMQPSQAPYLRAFERFAREEGAKGVIPTELYRSPERSASLDLTMPEGAPRAKPYSSGHNFGFAGDFAGITPLSLAKTKMTRGVGEPPTEEGAVRRAAKMAGVTLGADFSNPDPPHVQRTVGSFGSLAPRHGEIINLPPGAGEANLRGVVPAEMQEAAYAKARETLASRGVDPASKEGQGMMDNLMSYMRKNQEWLVPAGSFLRGMVQSKSPFLGAAVLEGLGSGMEAVGTAQQQIANLNLSRAQAMRQSLGLVAERFKMLPNGNYFDTVEQREISADQRNEIMRSLGLPIGAAPNAAGQAKEVLQKAGIEIPLAPTAGTKNEPAPQPEVKAATTEPKPTPPVGPTVVKMSDEYPDIPIVKSQTTIMSERILAQAEQNPDVQSWKQRVSEYQSRADQAQKNADALRGRGDNTQAETYQKQANELRASAAQAQEQMLLTRDKVASPEMDKLKGQTNVGQERDAMLLKQATESYPKIQSAKYRLAEMRHNFEKLPSTGWLATGKFGEEKTEFAKSINDFANTFGAGQPFDTAQVAAAAAIQKDSIRLGEDLAKSLGNNNAAAIVNQSVAATPSLATPELGWKLLLGSLDQANKFMEDQASFLNRYWEVNQTLEGAQEAFAKAYPVESYVNAAMVSIVPPADADALRAAVGTPNEKVAKERIDKKYGRGTAKVLLGG